ncbi:HTH domain-containing protein [Haloarchaeobius sp. HRN-SO-5]|uniref:HTH domain-containing protein n=1 Tax=Haloarchaeobius sp. HRN-SO-5 TaxID=3446118 RepID=UPI003EC151C1
MTANRLTLEVYTRAYAAVSEPEDHVARLVRTLVDEGVVDGFRVHSWPSAVRMADDTDVVRRYRAFAAWADDAGVSIDRAFRCCTEHNWLTGEHCEKLATPLVTLAVRQDDDLVAVLPCSVDEDEHVSVVDYLDALARGEDLLGTLDSGDRSLAVAQ